MGLQILSVAKYIEDPTTAFKQMDTNKFRTDNVTKLYYHIMGDPRLDDATQDKKAAAGKAMADYDGCKLKRHRGPYTQNEQVALSQATEAFTTLLKILKSLQPVLHLQDEWIRQSISKSTRFPTIKVKGLYHEEHPKPYSKNGVSWGQLKVKRMRTLHSNPKTAFETLGLKRWRLHSVRFGEEIEKSTDHTQYDIDLADTALYTMDTHLSQYRLDSDITNVQQTDKDAANGSIRTIMRILSRLHPDALPPSTSSSTL